MTSGIRCRTRLARDGKPVVTAASDGSADILELIYDAALDPSRWDEAVARIVARTNSVSASLATQRGNTVHLSAIHNIDPFYADAYAKRWYRNNPLDVFKTTVAPGELKAYTRISQADRFKATAYFNEFVRPQGWGDGVIACLRRGPTSVGYFGVIRSSNRIWIEPAEWHLLESLVPHVQRAVEVDRLLARATAITDSLGQAFAAAGFGVFLVTEDCRILFTNAEAEELLRRCVGLVYRWGHLTASDRAVGERLQGLVRGGSKPARGTGGTLELRCDDQGRRLIAHVIPLAPRRTSTIVDVERPAAAVLVVDPNADLLARVRHFAASSRLTGTETRVLAEIIRGSSISAAAVKMKIAEGTVRTHVKRIFEKTGVTRQTDLVRRFFEASLPGFRGGS